MDVRGAVPGDTEAIRRVARRAWHDVYDEALGERAVEQTIDEQCDLRRLEESIENEQRPLFVAVTDEIVGFAQGDRAGTDPLARSCRGSTSSRRAGARVSGLSC